MKMSGISLFIEGGQRPVTAAPPFWVLAVWDLDGMTGRVCVRTCVDAIVDWLVLGRLLADLGNFFA